METSRRDYTVSFERANVIAIALFAAVAVVALTVHALIWKVSVAEFVDAMFEHSLLSIVPVAGASIVGHELLHAVGFRVAGKVPWRAVRFGINWKGMAPYASTSVPMPARAYRWSVVLPSLFLGLPQLLIGIATGWELGTAYGVVMLGAAGGDYAALWAMRAAPSSQLVRDSPTRVGCEVAI